VVAPLPSEQHPHAAHRLRAHVGLQLAHLPGELVEHQRQPEHKVLVLEAGVARKDGLPAEVRGGLLERPGHGLCGALTFDPRPAKGVWTQEGMRYDDELFRLALDVPDTDDSRHWIATFKKELLQRFDQLEIYIVSYPVEVH
jgi:hypothetical protein